MIKEQLAQLLSSILNNYCYNVVSLYLCTIYLLLVAYLSIYSLPVKNMCDYSFTLDDTAKKYAEENLNETEETRTTSLTEIKRWLKEEVPYLNARLDDKHLLAFLRGCKFRMEKTKTKLLNYYTMRRDEPAWFCNRDPQLKEIQDLVKLGVFVPLRQSCDNRLVVIIRAAAHNPKIHKQDNVFKAGKMILDIAAMENELCQIYGVAAIFDMSGVNFWHGKAMTPSVIKRAVHAWQNYHCRPKQFEFINAPLYINVVLNIFKNFMTDKMKSRIRVHFNGISSLHQVINREMLPVEYGGDGESIHNLIAFWNEKLLSYRGWFKDDEKYKRSCDN